MMPPGAGLHEQSTGVGEAQPATVPLQNLHPALAFQGCELLGDGRRLEAERGRRRYDRSMHCPSRFRRSVNG